MDSKEFLKTKLEDLNFLNETGKAVSFLSEIQSSSAGDNSIYTTDQTVDSFGNPLFRQETTKWGDLQTTFLHQCYHYNSEVFPTHVDIFGKAFRISIALMKGKIIKEPTTVEKFIELVTAIADEL